MNLLAVWLHPLAWLAWIVYWRVAARGAKADARRDTSALRWVYIAPIGLAAWLFWLPIRIPALRAPLLPNHPACYGAGTVLLLLGMAVSVWARIELGRNWSNVVTVKVGHELIESGPYRWMRHPIYTGILLSITGSALAQDMQIDVLIPLLVLSSFWFKLRREEEWMREQFGAQYQAYCARTRRLIPFVF